MTKEELKLSYENYQRCMRYIIRHKNLLSSLGDTEFGVIDDFIRALERIYLTCAICTKKLPLDANHMIQNEEIICMPCSKEGN